MLQFVMNYNLSESEFVLLGLELGQCDRHHPLVRDESRDFAGVVKS